MAGAFTIHIQQRAAIGRQKPLVYTAGDCKWPYLVQGDIQDAQRLR